MPCHLRMAAIVFCCFNSLCGCCLSMFDTARRSPFILHNLQPAHIFIRYNKCTSMNFCIIRFCYILWNLDVISSMWIIIYWLWLLNQLVCKSWWWWPCCQWWHAWYSWDSTHWQLWFGFTCGFRLFLLLLCKSSCTINATLVYHLLKE